MMHYSMWLLVASLFLVVHGFKTAPNQAIAAIFDTDDFKDFFAVFNQTYSENQLLASKNFTVHSIAVNITEDIKTSFTRLCDVFDSWDVRLVLVVARQRTVQTVSQVAHPLGIPVIAYTTDSKVGKYVQVHNPLLLMLKPSKVAQAKAFLQFFQVNFWFNIVLIVQDNFVVDGFYDEIRKNASNPRWNIVSEIVSPRIESIELYKLAKLLLSNEPRVVIIHTELDLAKRIFQVADKANLTQINHAWFITETSYTTDNDDIQPFPPGTLAIVPNYAVNTEDVIVDGTNFIIKAVIHLPDAAPGLRSCWTIPSGGYEHVGRDVFTYLVKLKMTGKSGGILFDEHGQLLAYPSIIQNLVEEESQRFWRRIGHIQADDITPFGIVWPGESITSQYAHRRKKYRIVTNPVKPFVMDESPHRDYETCAKDTTCVYINSTCKYAIIRALDDYENGIHNESNPYEIKCCRGLSLDLLNRLASDLDFDYSLYIVSDRQYGKEINGSWNGMVRDLMSGAAHMAIAAFSITRSRVKAIDFTSPYFFSGFSVLYSEKHRDSNMQAFLEPFDAIVWFAIIISATVTAIVMGIFEWNSPFGLNPWGKKRKQNYTLASGMTMVYSVLFGHTVKTKSPKAWPSKVMQNFWAFSCIFIIASYTANLAAFIAGKHAGIVYSSIHDSRLLDINVGVLPGSASEMLVKKLNPRLYTKCQKHQVDTTDNAINRLINSNLDAYLGDYPILDYARAKLDPDCKLRLLTQTFGEDGYGIALPKGSPLKSPISKKVQDYHESGYVEDLIDVHFADSQCYKQRIKQEDSRLEVTHHAGSFVMLCVGIIFGIGILFLEHAVFKWMVPALRSMPGSSVWKSVHVMFFSQRLHRTITSAELVPANETCREMLGMVRNRDFMKLFQKSTIRTNKMADAAKRKRLNRNFFDIVEKARWMKEMQDNNLFGDDDENASKPEIKEFSLRDITQAVDLTQLRRQNMEENQAQKAAAGNDSEDFWTFPSPSKHKKETSEQISDNIPETIETGAGSKSEPVSNFLTKSAALLDCSPDMPPGEMLLPEKTIVQTPCDFSVTRETPFIRTTTVTSLGPGESPLPPIAETVSPGHGEHVYDVIDRKDTKNDVIDSTSSFFPTIPNGGIKNGQQHQIVSGFYPQRIYSNEFAHISEDERSPLARQLSVPSKQKDSRTYHPRKRQTIHGNRRQNDQNDGRNFNLEKFTKEELLLMWKSSELELNEKLDAARKDKERLRSKLSALKLQMSTPV